MSAHIPTKTVGTCAPPSEMIVRFAEALEVSTEDILRPMGAAPWRGSPADVLRRLEQIESLSPHKQCILLGTIDTLLRAG